MKTSPKTAKRGQRQDKHQRWCPPKPLVGLQPIERMLNRHTFTRCPESRLAVAVIVRAIGDCLSRDLHRERREARRFILGDEVIHWCDWVGLNPDFVRLVARKAGYLADEKLYWRRVGKKASAAKQPLDQNAAAAPTPAAGPQGDLS